MNDERGLRRRPAASLAEVGQPPRLIRRGLERLGQSPLLPTGAPTVTPEEAGKDRHQGTISDVPMYGGNPARTGEMPGPDPYGQIGELWRVETGATIVSSPAVVDGVVYIGTYANKDKTGTVLALDALTGDERWRFDAGGFESSPAVHDGRVYIAGMDGYLYALNADDGKVLRRFELAGETYCLSGSSSSPLVIDTLVIANFGCYGPEDIGEDVTWADLSGRLVAFDTASGAEVWRFTTKGLHPHDSPAVSDGIVVIADWQGDQGFTGTVYALDAATGAELWRFDAKTGFAVTPAIANGRVYLTGANGELYTLDLKTGVELWRVKIGGEGAESPAVSAGVVYGGTAGPEALALDADTGVEIWRAGNMSASGSAPAITDSTVYVPGADGTLYALDRVSGQSLPELSFSLRHRGPIYSSPAVSGGVVFVANSFGVIAAYGDIRTTVPIENGMQVEVVGEGTLLRAAPSSAAVVRGELQLGTRLQVVGAAEERNGQTWWPVDVPDLGTGWVPASAIVATDVTPTPVLTPTP